jgi:protocatechuate 3,4-dioxygenase alpha subunit
MSREPLHAAVPPAPGQTVGPFFHFGLIYPRSHEIVSPDAPDAVRLHGRVLDGAGQPVPDAMVELWQAAPNGGVPDAAGSFARHNDSGSATFTGWGRSATNAEGQFEFWTLEPGSSEGAAFCAAAVFARGLMDRLFTRIYVPHPATSSDRFLESIPQERRSTLIARRDEDGSLRHDIVLQGEAETVFLNFAAPGGHASA